MEGIAEKLTFLKNDYPLPPSNETKKCGRAVVSGKEKNTPDEIQFLLFLLLCLISPYAQLRNIMHIKCLC